MKRVGESWNGRAASTSVSAGAVYHDRVCAWVIYFYPARVAGYLCGKFGVDASLASWRSTGIRRRLAPRYSTPTLTSAAVRGQPWIYGWPPAIPRHPWMAQAIHGSRHSLAPNKAAGTVSIWQSMCYILKSNVGYGRNLKSKV